MFPCVYVCGSVYVCVCVRVRLYVCIYMYYVCIHVCVYVYIYVCPCVYVWARLYALVITWLCRCTRTHCFCAYFRVIPFCTSSRGGQFHSLGAACQGYLSSLRVLSAVSGRQIWALFVFVFQFLVHFTEDSRGANNFGRYKPGWFRFFFSCTDFTGIVSLLSS